jgi:hypothetical protein
VRWFWHAKDGGPQSTVDGWWLTEIKSLFSAVLLRFADGSRDAYHSHAFDSVNWVLRGRVVEHHLDGRTQVHESSLYPVVTSRSTLHKVVSEGTTWVLSLRGPWARTWYEYVDGKLITMTHGRKVVT